MLRQEGPGGATDGEDLGQNVWPGPSDRIRVDAAGHRRGRTFVNRRWLDDAWLDDAWLDDGCLFGRSKLRLRGHLADGLRLADRGTGRRCRRHRRPSPLILRGGRTHRCRRSRPDSRRDTTDLQAAFETIQAGGIPALPGGARQQDPGADQLELQSGRGGAGHLGQAGVDDVRGARQCAGPKCGGLLAHPLELVLGDAAQDRRGAVRDGGNHDQVAQAFEQVLDETPGVVAGLDDLVDLAEHGAAVASGEAVDRGIEQLALGEPEQRSRSLIGQALVAGTGNQLVEHGQRVPHRAAAGTNDERENTGGDRDLLGGAHLAQVVLQPQRGHEPERVVVGARPDRADDLLGLGRGEDELHVLRGLLDDLEQRVEALRRHHVRLVDDVDPVARLRRPVCRPLAQVARVVDTSVAGRVDLDDINTARARAGQRVAGLAHPARDRRRPLRAVQAARQDPCRSRLAAAARAAEQVGVVDPPGPQRLHQGLGHVLLADDVGEGLGPVAAIQRCAHAPNLVGSPDTTPALRLAHERTPRVPGRARLPLLPSGPGGVR